MVTNVDGVFLTFRAFIPGVIAGGCGSLIAVSTMTGKRPLFGRTPCTDHPGPPFSPA